MEEAQNELIREVSMLVEMVLPYREDKREFIKDCMSVAFMRRARTLKCGEIEEFWFSDFFCENMADKLSISTSSNTASIEILSIMQEIRTEQNQRQWRYQATDVPLKTWVPYSEDIEEQEDEPVRVNQEDCNGGPF